MKRVLVRSDVLSAAAYEQRRPQLLGAALRCNRARKVLLGSHASLTFESWTQVLVQIQEMLRAERNHTPEQLEDELKAYAPLVPDGHSAVVTLMFEVENPVARDKLLRELGGVEDTLKLTLHASNRTLSSVVAADDGVTRTTADGKTSAVHFRKFAPISKTEWLTGGPIEITCTHPRYYHSVRLTDDVVKEVANDFD